MNSEGFASPAQLLVYYDGASVSEPVNESRIVKIFTVGTGLFYCSSVHLFGPKVTQATLTPIVPAHLFTGQSKTHEQYERVEPGHILFHRKQPYIVLAGGLILKNDPSLQPEITEQLLLF